MPFVSHSLYTASPTPSFHRHVRSGPSSLAGGSERPGPARHKRLRRAYSPRPRSKSDLGAVTSSNRCTPISFTSYKHQGGWKELGRSAILQALTIAGYALRREAKAVYSFGFFKGASPVFYLYSFTKQYSNVTLTDNPFKSSDKLLPENRICRDLDASGAEPSCHRPWSSQEVCGEHTFSSSKFARPRV